MGAENTYLKNNLPVIYRKAIMDVVIYTFIDTQRFTIPSISIQESAKAFLIHYNIEEGAYSIDSVLQSYLRTRKQLIDEQKTNKA